jgi:hypothetical protein
MRLPQPVGPGPHIYMLQEQGGQVIPSGSGFPFVASYEPQGYVGGTTASTRGTAVQINYVHLLLGAIRQKAPITVPLLLQV